MQAHPRAHTHTHICTQKHTYAHSPSLSHLFMLTGFASLSATLAHFSPPVSHCMYICTLALLCKLALYVCLLSLCVCVCVVQVWIVKCVMIKKITRKKIIRKKDADSETLLIQLRKRTRRSEVPHAPQLEERGRNALVWVWVWLSGSAIHSQCSEGG